MKWLAATLLLAMPAAGQSQTTVRSPAAAITPAPAPSSAATPNTGGRTIEQIARDFDVSPDEVREAFARAAPVQPGDKITDEDREANQAAVAHALGVTPETLASVMSRTDSSPRLAANDMPRSRANMAADDTIQRPYDAPEIMAAIALKVTPKQLREGFRKVGLSKPGETPSPQEMQVLAAAFSVTTTEMNDVLCRYQPEGTPGTCATEGKHGDHPSNSSSGRNHYGGADGGSTSSGYSGRSGGGYGGGNVGGFGGGFNQPSISNPGLGSTASGGGVPSSGGYVAPSTYAAPTATPSRPYLTYDAISRELKKPIEQIVNAFQEAGGTDLSKPRTIDQIQLIGIRLQVPYEKIIELMKKYRLPPPGW